VQIILADIEHKALLMNDVAQLPLKYISPFQVTMATSISRYKLENLIRSGVIKAKRMDSQTVLIEWDSVARYLDSLPDVAQETDHVAPQDPMDSYRVQYRKAMDLFSEKIEAQP
jgi:hypothetical protein